jgi:hypothetical protein
MSWFYVDDAFADSKPVMQIDKALRNEAIGLWLRCGAWSAKEETDGRVPLDVVKQFGGTPRIIRALIEQAELWTENRPDSHRKSGEIWFKNWEKWQKTRAENEARRKREAEKKSTYRAGKKGRGYVPTSGLSETDEPEPETPANSCPPGTPQGSPSTPTQTRPGPYLSLVTSVGGVTSVDAREPARQCQSHINDPTPPRCGHCADARKLHAEWTARQHEHRQQVKAEHWAAISGCEQCDERGFIETPAGLVRCQHQAVLHG